MGEPGPKPKPCSVPAQCDMPGACCSGSSFQASAIAAMSEGCSAEAEKAGGGGASFSAFSAFFFFFSSLPTPQKAEAPLGGGETLLDPGVHSSSSVAFGGRSSSVIGVRTGPGPAED